MKETIDGKNLTRVYDSLAEFADSAKAALRHPDMPERVASTDDDRTKWCGGSFADALTMARKGWTDHLAETLELAESAVTLADREHMMDSFNEPVWDVTGAMVDVGAYLAGTPECMIDYPLSKTSKQGRVITLVASVTVSAIVSTSTMVRRGQVTVALALALTQLGHAIEIWADYSSGKAVQPAWQAVRIKGVNDELDPAVIMFALAHPAMLRRLCLAHSYSLPGKWGSGRRKNSGWPIAPDPAMYPEGAIILPELCTDEDVPNADEFLRRYLGELGLLAE